MKSHKYVSGLLFVFFLCQLIAYECKADDMISLIYEKSIEIIAKPSIANIGKSQNIKIDLYIHNKSNDRVDVRITGFGEVGDKIRRVIKGVYYNELNNNISVVGYDDETSGPIEGAITVSIDARSFYKIPEGINRKPFEIFSNKNIESSDVKFAVYSVTLTVDGTPIKSNDFILTLIK